MNNVVYVAHCIDTEGPLFESLEATFNRLKNIFGIELEPSRNNLQRLQKREVELGGIEEEVAKVVQPRYIDTHEDWSEIENQLDFISKKKFRSKHEDSYGGEWKYSWFVLDHVGFEGSNPRRRALGHHVVYDQYIRWLDKKNMSMDEINWHYHPLSIRRDAHRSGTGYMGSKNIFEALARKIIDRQWFPVAYRPGFHTERPDSHWFLEQWIPFDFGNQSGKTAEGQPDLARGRFGSWRRAPTSWIPYHPAHDDYQSRGNCRRYIARCLNMDTRHRNLTRDDIEQAFAEAKREGEALLAFTDHDHRRMEAHVEKVWSMIDEVSSNFETVHFKSVTATEGIRSVLDINKRRAPKLNAKIKNINEKDTLKVNAKNRLFGPQPFLALKTKSGEYYWQNLDRPREDTWTYTFDFHTLPLEAIENIGIAANSPDGVTEVINYTVDNGEYERETYNE